METGPADPVLIILAAALVGLLVGVGIILSIPKRQSTLRIMFVGLALCLLISDALGHHIVPFGFGIDPAEVEGRISLPNVFAPRIAFLSFLMGVLSAGISKRVQTMAGLVVVTAMFFGPIYLSGSTQATAWGIYN